MKCQVCQTRAATVHYTVLTDGPRSYHLCEECYAMQKPAGAETDSLGMIAAALTSGPAAAPGNPAEVVAAQVCTECGLTYATFRNRGRLGCPSCYDAFRAHLEPLLEKIHGGKAHVGKSPGEGAVEDRSRDRQLIALRRKLQDAIQQENYELAASLRDELRRAETGGGDA